MALRSATGRKEAGTVKNHYGTTTSVKKGESTNGRGWHGKRIIPPRNNTGAESHVIGGIVKAIYP